MSEKLCIQWNDFQDNIKSVFGNLRENNDFTDVTLACEDGQQVEAHKVILAASSPFFQKLLGSNKHPHPLIYMRGMKTEDLFAIVDFLYRGEANVFQENLDSFLAVAEELQLKGLMGKTDDYKEDEKSLVSTFSPGNVNIPKTVERQAPNRNIRNIGENRTLAIPGNNSGDFKELDERVKSMMEKSLNQSPNGAQAGYICKVCGKEDKHSGHIKDHIEANHLEGIIIPCNLCDKTFRSRNGFRLHKSRHHTNNWFCVNSWILCDEVFRSRNALRHHKRQHLEFRIRDSI